MKTYITQKGHTTITISKTNRNKLIYLKIKTQAKNLNEVIQKLMGRKANETN